MLVQPGERDALVARYERLRRCACEPHLGQERRGLALLLRHGMAAWIEAWLSCAVRDVPAIAAADADKPVLPDSVRSELIHVLAGMTWNRLQEICA
ncbi:MAG: hypothetical protein JSV80_16890 [Acidobacteriota bacterium]|nr:MAG: hypothetical protein JSV80_16890 [Acidobacteriota bacterium]